MWTWVFRNTFTTSICLTVCVCECAIVKDWLFVSILTVKIFCIQDIVHIFFPIRASILRLFCNLNSLSEAYHSSGSASTSRPADGNGWCMPSCNSGVCKWRQDNRAFRVFLKGLQELALTSDDRWWPWLLLHWGMVKSRPTLSLSTYIAESGPSTSLKSPSTKVFFP